MSFTVAFTTETDPAARGRAFGAAYAAEIAANWRAYDMFFGLYDLDAGHVRRVADGSFERVADWAPALAAEIAGVAEGAGLERWQVAALNARSEVIAHVRVPVPVECSTAVHLRDGAAPLTMQSWDWNDRMTHGKVVHRYATATGRTVTTFTEFGILGKIGVNSAGLGTHFNLLQHDVDGEFAGVPVHLVARRVIDEATTLDEAWEIARGARVSASAVLTVATFDGERSDAASLEISPAGVARVPVRADGHLLHTNHFIDETLAAGERLGAADADTYARLDALDAAKRRLEASDPADRAAVYLHHAEDGAALCAHPDEADPPRARWATQAMVAIDLERGRLQVRDGRPCVGDLRQWVVV